MHSTLTKEVNLVWTNTEVSEKPQTTINNLGRESNIGTCSSGPREVKKRYHPQKTPQNSQKK